MNKLTLILTTGFLFFGFSSSAQVNTDQNDPPRYSKPAVTKGYYSIGDNAGKLSQPTSWGVTGESYAAVQKGYYAIGDNNRKLSKKTILKMNGKPSIPVTTKGFYSIGRNRENPGQ